MRLIDTDKLKKDILLQNIDRYIHIVDEQPTAFDVDKVVEQLENYLFEKYCIEEDTIIDEIIKGGETE